MHFKLKSEIDLTLIELRLCRMMIDSKSLLSLALSFLVIQKSPYHDPKIYIYKHKTKCQWLKITILITQHTNFTITALQIHRLAKQFTDIIMNSQINERHQKFAINNAQN